MIKKIITFLLFSSICFAQNCNCKSNPQLNEIITCKKTIFKNGAKLYRQFNCDSSWVVFEYKNKKRILDSLDKELIDLTGRLGFSNWEEYKNTFLVTYRNISGCCYPNNDFLYNKTNGKKIIDFGMEILSNEENNSGYTVYLDTENFNVLYIVNLTKGFYFEKKLPQQFIKKTLDIADIPQSDPRQLIEFIDIKNGLFTFKYNYKIKKNGKWLIGLSKVDLKKELGKKSIVYF
ncbi:MAG: hypothetical protein QM535_02255 [Limnohabitans sp.]|nr:hypothetical protein [Limnohabitans sp.]